MQASQIFDYFLEKTYRHAVEHVQPNRAKTRRDLFFAPRLE